MNLLTQTLAVKPDGFIAGLGHLFLRVSVGLMIFYIHGFHKLEGWISYLRHGTPWKLAEEVAGMGMPAPMLAAVFATVVQFVCSLFVIVGLFTRINATLLAGALGGAILQNLLAGRDPQLAVLYTLAVVSLVFLGGGRLSLDARILFKIEENRTFGCPPVNLTRIKKREIS